MNSTTLTSEHAAEHDRAGEDDRNLTYNGTDISYRGLQLTCGTHADLFWHDEDIIRQFHQQLDTASQHISNLEAGLEVATNECRNLRMQIYDKETGYANELQTRLTFQRHLELEQKIHQNCLEARNELQLKSEQAATEAMTACAFNDMLRQEILRCEQIIGSMATRISELERDHAETISVAFPVHPVRTPDSSNISGETKLDRNGARKGTPPPTKPLSPNKRPDGLLAMIGTGIKVKKARRSRNVKDEGNVDS